MTFKDKPKKPGAKPSGGGRPFKAAAKGPGKPGGKPAGKPAGKFAAKPERRDAAAAKAAKPLREKPAAVAAESAAGQPERISKIMARAGVASRRDVERMIMEGRVRLNGVVLETPVVNATLADRIEVDGVPIRGIERTRLWLYHKPAGLVTTNADPEGRPTVFDNLPEGLPRVLSVGRLDINTEGLLLLTNDGGLARVLELPATGWLRRYRVRAHGKIDQAELDRLKDGIAVEGVLYGGIEATLDRVQGSNVWITMAFREGKNREVKNVLGALGLEVNRLIRLSYGPFQLGDLPEGEVVEVRGRMLRDQLGPRLLEEAGANFDAPLYDNAAPAEEEPVPAKPAARREERAEWGGEKRGERPARKDGDRKAANRREDDRKGGRGFDRAGGKPGREAEAFDDRPKRPKPGTSRTANVWRAPGARPLSPKKAGKPGRPLPEPAVRAVPENTLKPAIRRSGEDNEWIGASEVAPRGPRDGERGGRGERPFRPRGEAGERGFSGERREKPFGDRREGAKPFGDKRGGKPPGGKREGGGSFGDKPPGGKSFGKSFGKPGGGKGLSGKPRGDRPAGGRPGGKPFAGKPGGGRGKRG